jgi:hypothetical protein
VNRRWSEDVPDAGGEAEAQERAQGEDVGGGAVGVGVVLLGVEVGLVVAQPVDDVEGLAVVGADDLGVVGQADVGGVGVDGDPAVVVEVVGVALGVGRPDGDLDAHAVRRGAGAVAPVAGEGVAQHEAVQVGQGLTDGLLADVSVGGPSQLAVAEGGGACQLAQPGVHPQRHHGGQELLLALARWDLAGREVGEVAKAARPAVDLVEQLG